MKKYLNFTNLTYTLLIGIIIICLFKLSKATKSTQFYNSNIQLNNDIYNDIIGGLIVGEGRLINAKKFVVFEHNIDTLEIDNVIKPGVLLIYYNEINCMGCVEEAIKQLEEKSKMAKGFDYKIIAKYRNLRDALIFKKANNIKREILKPVTKQSETVFKDNAFIAIVGNDYTLHHVFILNNDSKEKLENYLELIQYSKYLNSID